MLTKKQIDDIRNCQSDEFGPSEDAITVVLDELEAQRPVVLAALKCTGEDGKDGIVDLVVAAEEYLEKLQKSDEQWLTRDLFDNIERVKR